MIDGNLAYKADEPDVCEWRACQWPGGCKRGGVRLVVKPGFGELWLCRRHADETCPRRPAIKVRKLDEPRACQWPGGCKRGGVYLVVKPGFGERWLCLHHAGEVRAGRPAGKGSATAPARPRRATRRRSVAVNKESAPAQAVHHRRRRRWPGLGIWLGVGVAAVMLWPWVVMEVLSLVLLMVE